MHPKMDETPNRQFAFRKWIIISVCLLNIIDLLLNASVFHERITDIDIEHEFPHVQPKDLNNIRKRITKLVIMISASGILFQLLGMYSVWCESIRLVKTFAVVSILFGIFSALACTIEPYYWFFSVCTIVNSVIALLYLGDLLAKQSELMNLIEF